MMTHSANRADELTPVIWITFLFPRGTTPSIYQVADSILYRGLAISAHEPEGKNISANCLVHVHCATL